PSAKAPGSAWKSATSLSAYPRLRSQVPGHARSGRTAPVQPPENRLLRSHPLPSGYAGSLRKSPAPPPGRQSALLPDARHRHPVHGRRWPRASRVHSSGLLRICHTEFHRLDVHGLTKLRPSIALKPQPILACCTVVFTQYSVGRSAWFFGLTVFRCTPGSSKFSPEAII